MIFGKLIASKDKSTCSSPTEYVPGGNSILLLLVVFGGLAAEAGLLGLLGWEGHGIPVLPFKIGPQSDIWSKEGHVRWGGDNLQAAI